MSLSELQIAELRRTKQYFPYRLVFGAVNPGNGEFVIIAKATKHQANKLIREGWSVWEIK